MLLPIRTLCLSEADVSVAIVVTLPHITHAAPSSYVVRTKDLSELKKYRFVPSSVISIIAVEKPVFSICVRFNHLKKIKLYDASSTTYASTGYIIGKVDDF